ncbi:L,D-transpeptidase family protein [Streptomyces sp. NPDC051567]|uniref:L,D-transpeptidase family protein n=1 Tax=Streptomyces sp. NPDC051567 TaxID=3365660 RepID=UPI0037A5208F
MSKHARPGSRPLSRVRRSRHASRHARRAPDRAALVAASCLLALGACWAYTVQHAPGPDAALARASDDRPPPDPGRAARGDRRDGLQGLTGISERTRARIPAGSRQLVLVLGRAKDSSEATAALYTRPAPGADWVRAGSWPARNGARGWSTERAYGDLTSPEGVFALTDAGGLLPAPPGTRLPYDENGSFVASGRGVNGESLAGSFDHVVAIGYNRRPGTSPLDPVRPDGEGRGGGIWLHVDHGGPSQGCVGVPKAAMRTVLETLDPAAEPVIVMGPQGF